MNIQAVIFDMGGTIETYDYTPEMRLQATPALGSLLHSFDIHLALNTADLYQVITTGLKAYHRTSVVTEEELPTAQVWKQYILPAYPQFFPAIEAHSEELMLWIDTHYYHRELRPEVPGVLAALKQMGITIGMVSNICSLGQVPLNLKLYGIADYFSFVITSSQFGRRKPDPSIFHYAAFCAGAPASRCAYVGDRVVRDIDGARRAGFGLAVQIVHNFDHGESDAGARPDAVITNMRELLAIIKTENSKPQTSPALNNPVKALLFDAGDILYFRPNRGVALKQFLLENSLSPTREGDALRKEIKWRGYRGEISRDAYFTEMVKSYGVVQPEQVARGKIILAEADDNIQFFDGVGETLRVLKNMGYLLGIITDTAVPASVKMSWFEKGGFGDVWDTYISSRELGCEKPDPRIYQAALDQLCLRPEQSAFVGHSPEELAGALAMGMHTIAYNPDDDAEAEHFAKKFSDIIEIVEGYSITQDEAA